MGRPLVFALNGKRVEVSDPDPSMTLLTYIRTFTPHRGTKLVCGEGGCGACVVVLAKYDVGSQRVEESTINSCLAPLCSVHLCAVTTTEGLGSSRDGLHPVHQRLAGFHASQCGFCTPGMAMAVYGRLRQQQGGQLTALEAEKAVQGNICRCTGYRPILDACKSFAADVDLEDLGTNSFWRDKEGIRPSLLPAYDRGRDPEFPTFLRREVEDQEWKGARFVDGGVEERRWVKVRSLEDVLAALGDHHGNLEEVRLVVGNTSQGVYKDARPRVFIDIGSVPELLEVKSGGSGVEVGAAVSISKFISFLEESQSRTSTPVYAQLATHLRRLASVHVRNRGSVGGNLVMAQQKGFDSDLATILLGAGASVRVASSSGVAVLSMEELLENGGREGGPTVLVSIIVPSWERDEGAAHGVKTEPAGVPRERVLFKTYRASPRPLGNAVAYVHAAFLAIVQQVDGRQLVRQVRLAFGAFGSRHAVLARRVEDFLTGKEVTAEVLLQAVVLLKSSVVPAEGTHKAAYRSSVLVGFLFDFFRPFLEERDVPATLALKVDELSLGNGSAGVGNGHLKGSKARTLTRGTQKFPAFREFYPVGDPSPKVVAELQASGEAVYVDDIPSPEGCLHAAFVSSQHALAELMGIDASLALASPGAVSLVTVDDIPKGGKNIALEIFGVTETLFAADKVECYGQTVALMVGDSPLHARDAAAKVEVKYDTEKLGAPILSIEDALAKESYFSIPPWVASGLNAVGDVEKGMTEAEEKIESGEVSIGAQYHFYMEAQSALAIPDEDGQIVVYSACQGTEFVQLVVAQCLGIPMNNVRIITRRLGGAFGGKMTKACIVAAACALAAWKLKRPVRVYLDRKTDMLIAGGRHPVRARYSAGFTKDGKITALQGEVIVDAGWSTDASTLVVRNIHTSLKKYNWGSLSVDYKVVKTNLPSKTVMRAPGDAKGTFIAEAVIEHVAATLGLTAQQVRDKNMHTVETAGVFWGPAVAGGAEGYTMPLLWEQLKAKSNFHAREEEVKAFNSTNRWRKRGIAMVPAVYELALFPGVGRVTAFADGSVVVEAGGIEMGQGLWTKVRQAAVYGLNQLWDEPGLGSVDVSRIRVVQADSISLGNGGFTGGSTTSESHCAAIFEACKVLVERLKPIKQTLETANPTGITWEDVLSTAKLTGVDLSVQNRWTAEREASEYVTCGAAVNEVEIDVLTGEAVILQTDLIYDCGKSLNPAVDIGQVEGSFVQGVGLYLTEEIQTDEKGRQISEGTWLYKPPTIDNIPRVFNVELLNSAPHRTRILSSKASGEPPLLLAAGVHCAVREAITAAKRDTEGERTGFFRLDSPATLDKIKTHCGLENVEHYLSHLAKQVVQ